MNNRLSLFHFLKQVYPCVQLIDDQSGSRISCELDLLGGTFSIIYSISPGLRSDGSIESLSMKRLFIKMCRANFGKQQRGLSFLETVSSQRYLPSINYGHRGTRTLLGNTGKITLDWNRNKLTSSSIKPKSKLACKGIQVTLFIVRQSR